MTDPTESRRDSIIPEWSRPVLLGGLGSFIMGALLLAIAWGQFTAHAESQAAQLEEQAARITKAIADHQSYRDLSTARMGALEVRQAEQGANHEALQRQVDNGLSEIKESLQRLEDRFGTRRRRDDQ